MSRYKDIYESSMPLPSAVPVLSKGRLFQSQMQRTRETIDYNAELDKRRKERLKKELEAKRLIEETRRREEQQKQEQRRRQEEEKRRREEEEKKRYQSLSRSVQSKLECYNLFLEQELWSNNIDEFRRRYKAKLILLHPDKVDTSDPQYEKKINTFRLLTDCKKDSVGINFEKYDEFKDIVQNTMSSYSFQDKYDRVNILSYFEKEIYNIIKDVNEILKGYGVDTKTVLAGWTALSEYTDYADDSIELRVFTNEKYDNRNIEVNKLRQYVANTITIELNKYIENNKHIIKDIKKEFGIELVRVNGKYFFQSYERFDIIDDKISYSDQEFSETIPEDRYTLFLSAVKFSFKVDGSKPYVANLIDIVNYDDSTRDFTVRITQLEENLYVLNKKEIKKDNDYILKYMKNKINKLRENLDEENQGVYDFKVKEKFGGYLERSLRLNNRLRLSNVF